MKIKENIKRIILLFVAALLSASSILSLASCSDDKKNLEVVGTVGKYEVHYEELRWLTMQFKDRLEETYGEGIWDNEETAAKYLPELKEAVYGSIVSNYAVLTLCDEINANSTDGSKFIDINGEDESEIVENYINQTIEEFGSRAAYRQGLKENYMTENLYRFMTGIDVCESILFNYYCSMMIIDDSDEAAVDYIYENFIRTIHIYIENGKDESVDENRSLANAIYQKLLNGDEMSELVEKYNEDMIMSKINGYYFTKNTYSDEYENAAFALEIGEFSEVVETYSGFYIIMRLELKDDYIALNFDTLKNRYLLAVFDEHIDACKDELSFVPNDYGASIDLIGMK